MKTLNNWKWLVGFIAFFLFIPLRLAADDNDVIVVTFVDDSQRPIEGAVILYNSASVPLINNSLSPVMDQINRQFVPEVLLVRVGQHVNFPNSDDIRHHVYSLSRAKRFELKLYSGTDAPPVFFDEPGIVVLGCNIHDQMKGFVYVLAETQQGEMTDVNGQIILPRDASAISFWHPNLDLIVTKHVDIQLDMSREMAQVQVTLTQTKSEDKPEQPVFGRSKLRGKERD